MKKKKRKLYIYWPSKAQMGGWGNCKLRSPWSWQQTAYLHISSWSLTGLIMPRFSTSHLHLCVLPGTSTCSGFCCLVSLTWTFNPTFDPPFDIQPNIRPTIWHSTSTTVPSSTNIRAHSTFDPPFDIRANSTFDPKLATTPPNLGSCNSSMDIS